MWKCSLRKRLVLFYVTFHIENECSCVDVISDKFVDISRRHGTKLQNFIMYCYIIYNIMCRNAKIYNLYIYNI